MTVIAFENVFETRTTWYQNFHGKGSITLNVTMPDFLFFGLFVQYPFQLDKTAFWYDSKHLLSLFFT